MTRWQESALCAQADPELWFPEGGGHSHTAAITTCQRCPVITQCREAGAAEEYGIWGGIPATGRPGTRVARRAARARAA